MFSDAPRDRQRTAAPRIELDSIVRTVGARTVLDDVSLTVAAHEIVAVIDSGGSNVNALLRVAAGMIPTNSGTARLLGATMPVDRALVAARCTTIIDEPSVFPFLTASENLELVARARRTPSPARTARSALAQVGLEHEADLHAAVLHHAERRALGLARAMLEQPEVLIVDEPFRGLPAEAVLQVSAVLHGLADRGTAVLMTCGNVTDARRIADRILTLVDGRIVDATRFPARRVGDGTAVT